MADRGPEAALNQARSLPAAWNPHSPSAGKQARCTYPVCSRRIINWEWSRLQLPQPDEDNPKNSKGRRGRRKDAIEIEGIGCRQDECEMYVRSRDREGKKERCGGTIWGVGLFLQKEFRKLRNEKENKKRRRKCHLIIWISVNRNKFN